MNLVNHFLIAMPSMQDPYFKQSVIYICEHNEEGAMGLIINMPINLTIDKMLEQIEVEPNASLCHFNHLQKQVLNGGPVFDDRGFILHYSAESEPSKDNYRSILHVTDRMSLTTSKDILSTLGTATEPSLYLVALGCSTWRYGQLEEEIADNAWLTVEADPYIIFNIPAHDRWNQSVKKLGINPFQLSSQLGHA